MSCETSPLENCTSCSGQTNPCDKDCTESTATCESLPSALDNFIKHFFGSVVKTLVDGKIQWTLPCDLEEGLPGNPRAENEGLACYFLRLFSDGILSIPSGTEFKNNFSANADPSTGNDDLDGYSVGSQWLNQDTLVLWECVDNTTGAAEWKAISRPVADEKFQAVSGNDHSFVHSALAKVSSGWTDWTTLRTISFPGGISGKNLRGFVQATLTGNGNGFGTGLLIAKWFFSLINGVPGADVVAEDVLSGPGAPEFRIQVSGETFLLQAKKNASSSSFSGMASLEIHCPNAAEGIQYSIA